MRRFVKMCPRIFSFIASVCTLAACSTAPIPASAPTAREGRPNAIIQIDARPGEFQLLRGSLDAKDGALPETMRFVFEIKKLQPSSEWRPTLSFCSYVGADTQLNCVQVVHQEIEHLVPSTLSKADADSNVKTGKINNYLAQGEKHTVDMAFTKGLVSFSLDGKLVSEQTAKVVPESYYVSCSSVICDIAIYQPPGRP